MTQSHLDLLPCDNCGRLTHVDLLDAKPRSLAGKKCTVRDLSEATGGPMCFWRGFLFWLLGRGRDTDFSVLECQDCYGPAWESNVQPGSSDKEDE